MSYFTRKYKVVFRPFTTSDVVSETTINGADEQDVKAIFERIYPSLDIVSITEQT